MWFTIELLATGLESFLQFFCLYKIFQPKYSKRVNIIAFATFAALHTAIVTWIGTTGDMEMYLSELIYVVINIIYSIFFLKGNNFFKIFICFLIEIIIAMSVLITVSIVNPIMSVDYGDTIASQDLARLLILIISKIILLYGIIILIKATKKSKSKLSSLEWILIIVTMLCSFTIGLVMINMIFLIKLTLQNAILSLIAIFALIGINFITIYILGKISKKNHEINQLQINEKVLKQQEQSIDDMNRHFEEIKKFRHDYKNIISCAINMMESNRDEDAKDYLIKCLDDTYVTSEQYVEISDPIIAAVINSKLSVCRQKKIETKCDIFTKFKKVDSTDLSIVLFNLLDNAIEAQKGLDNPYIEISIKEAKGKLFVDINNRIKKSVLKDNENMLTTKPDKEYHGLGIKRVKDIIQKHNGLIQYLEKDDMLHCNILFL